MASVTKNNDSFKEMISRLLMIERKYLPPCQHSIQRYRVPHPVLRRAWRLSVFGPKRGNMTYLRNEGIDDRRRNWLGKV